MRGRELQHSPGQHMMVDLDRTVSMVTPSWNNPETMMSGCPANTNTSKPIRNAQLMGWLLSAGSFLILSTNLLVVSALILLLRRKGGQSWCFVLNLAVADVLVGLAITGIATDAVQGTTSSMEKSQCLLRMAFVISPTTASILTMFLISLDRYMAIKLPLHYERLVGRKAMTGALITLWGVSVGFAVLPCVVKPMQQKDYDGVCTFFSVIEERSIIVLFAAIFFPVLSVFVYFYLDILKIACDHQRQIRRTQFTGPGDMLGSRAVGHVKALRTVALLVGCFTLCWCPFFIVSLVQVLCPSCELKCFLENHLWLLGLSNSLINPLVYACWQKEVRQQICALFAGVKAKLGHVIGVHAVDQCHTNRNFSNLMDTSPATTTSLEVTREELAISSVAASAPERLRNSL